jgi:hypothetical protein
MLTFPKPEIFPRFLTMAMLLIVFGCIFVPVASAQKYPIALGKKSPMSPRNQADYAALVEQYAIAACISTASHNRSTGCTYNASEADRLRTDLVFTALSQSDEVFRDYRTKRRRWSDAFELLANFLEIGLSTAVSITNGLRAKSVLSDVTTLIQGTHRAVSKDLRLQENQVLFNVMETKRGEILSQMLDKLTKPDSVYSYPVALMDIMRYCKAGTLDEALAELATNTGIDKRATDEKVLQKSETLAGIVPTPVQANLSKKARDLLVQLRNESVIPSPDTEAAQKVRAQVLVTLKNILKAMKEDGVVLKAFKDHDSLQTIFNEMEKAADKGDAGAVIDGFESLKEEAFGVQELTPAMAKINGIIANEGK